MRQLASLDAVFLAHEGERTVGHVSLLAVLDPSTAPGGELTLDALRALLAERLALLPPFRWRLVEVPLRLDHGYWADDPDFDLEHHVREIRLDAPGADDDLVALAGRLFAERLDRARPLWQVWLVRGLADGRIGLVSKVHHALVDGVSGAEILGAIFDLGPEGRETPSDDRAAPDPLPGRAGLLLTSARTLPARARASARLVPGLTAHLGGLPGSGWLPGSRAAGRLTRSVARATTGDDLPLLEPSSGAAPETPFSGRLSGDLRFVRARLDLDEVKRVKSALDSTVNDVIMALATAGVRHWLASQDRVPDEPLLALVPVSVRTPEQFGSFGNRINAMVVPLPTNLRDPRERLAASRASMSTAKRRQSATPADLLRDVTRLLPAVVFTPSIKLVLRLWGRAGIRPPMNLIVSNVPGPQFPLYCAGARIETLVPLSPVTHGVGMNITVMSYCGRVDAGIVVDPTQVPHAELLVEGMERELAALLDLADAAAG
ncbi:MAG: wax ester/triacylglycerol synthase family O-acyltransferase [Solirubrobacteraceae bacterium]